MAEEQKPVVPTEAPVVPVVEPAPAPVEAPAETVAAADKPVESVEPATEEPAKADAEAAAPVEEKKEEKPVEPIYSGALGYKAPGLKNVFRFSKKYFWFGDEAVPATSLSQFLRGEKDVDHAHTVAAWSSVTGKGLLYFVKHADQKATPAGVLKLADATDLTKDGTVAFFFKLQGHKHAFEAQTLPERNSWFVAFEEAIKDAKAKTEEIVATETYKEQLTKLSKPALAVTAAKEAAPKKSTDATPKVAEPEVPATEAAVAEPTRTGSASSSSSDEEKRKKKASKSKSRSASRGKRASIFGGFLGKKEKVEEKKEEKKEEAEEKKEEEAEAKKADEVVPPVVSAAEESTVVAPVVATDAVKPVEETKAEETAAPAVPAAEEKPKPAKRASIFGNFVEKLRSPTSEKKEADLIPAPVPAAKEPEVAAEAPKVEEPVAAVAPATEAAAEAPKVEEAKPATNATPHKEKSSFSFGKFLGGAKEKVKSPTTEKAPASEAPKLEDPVKSDEAPVLAPVEPVAPIEPTAVTEAPKEEEATPAVATTPPQKKRGSIFGNLTGGSVKKEKDGEASEKKGLSGLFRSASKAAKTKKDEKTGTAAKVDETAEAKEEIPPVPAVPVTEEKKETPAVAEPTIGDVTADAVTVGQAPKSTSEVATTA